MRQKVLKSMKTLLVAAGLCVGVNAWADEASTIYTKSLSDWASSDVTTTEGEVSKWYNITGVTAGNNTGMKIDADKGLGVCASRTTATAELTLNRTQYSIVTLDAVWNVGSSSSPANTPHTYFTYGGLNITQTVDTRSVGTTCTINGNAVTLNSSFPVDAEMTIHLVVNSYTGAITEFYIKNGETTVADYSGLTSDNNSFPAGTNYDAIILKAVAGATSGSQQTKTYMKSITVKEEAQDVYSYTLNAVNSSSQVLKTLATGTCMAGSSVSLDYPSHINVNGTLYTTTALSDNSKQYRVTFTPNTDAYIKPITYTPSATTDVVYLVEAEDISGASRCTTAGNSTRCSGGATAYLSSTKLITLPKGSYKATVYNYNSSNSSRTVTISDGTDNVYSQSHGNGRTNASQEFVLSDTKTLYITGGHRSSGVVDDGIDLVYITGTPTNEIVGALDYSTEANAELSTNYTLKQGETKVITFQNHGTTYGNNWRIIVKEGATTKSVTRADSWDETTAAATKVAYLVSKDGGSTTTGLDWTEYAADMADANVVATLAYGTDGTLAITTTSTGVANGYIYYVDQDVTSLTNDLTINLSVNHSWIEVLSIANSAIAGTLPSSGYGSLASAYGLDFSNATGLTAAYVVTKTTNDAVTLTSVDELPANSGVILKGESNAAYSIPVKADAAYDGTNLLSAAVTATDIEANTAYILQGGQFHLVTAASTVPAGKAYLLKSNVPSAARALGIVFDEESTGINAVSREKQNGEFYNLQGQRVDTPKKGLYIVNGIKVIIK